MWYFAISALLLALVFIAPAIALAPQLLRRPATAIAIPLVSILCVTLCTDLLSTMGLFNSSIVFSLSLLAAALAIGRLVAQDKVFDSAAWTTEIKALLFINLLITIPYAVKIGTTAFDTDDEIYSWHFWALQWFHNLPISFTHTAAPYPQAFPKLIAWCYQIVGDTELSLPVKSTLFILPLTMLNAIAVAVAPKVRELGWSYFGLMIWLVFICNWQKYFDYAYAEPLMCASIVASAALLIVGARSGEYKTYWPLAVAMALLGAWSKQAALVWSMASLPAILLIINRSRFTFALAAASIAGSLWWVLGEGASFTNNGGVIGASMQDRGIFEQLMLSIKRYLIEMPQVALLYGLAIYAARKDKLLKLILLLFVLPATLLWFVFGAYQLRLGLHVVALLAVVVAAGGLPVLCRIEPVISRLKEFRSKTARLSLSALSIAFAVGVYQSSPVYKIGAAYPGSLVALHKYFDKDIDLVMDKLYNGHEGAILSASSYVHGLFYTRSPLAWPSKLESDVSFDYNDLVKDIKLSGANYVITSGRIRQGEIFNQVVYRAAAEHPELLKEMTTADNRHGYRIFQVITSTT